MKFFLIIYFLLLSITTIGQDNMDINESLIDTLSNENAVELFIRNIDDNHQTFVIKKVSDFDYNNGKFSNHCKAISDSLRVNKSYYKADFDQNGLTDILVIGVNYDFETLVVLDYNKGNYKAIRLSRRPFTSCEIPVVSDIEGIPIIEYFKFVNGGFTDNLDNVELKKSVLIYKFGDFIEYNKNPGVRHISRVDFKTSACYGMCPIFELVIKPNGKSVFKAERFNVEILNEKEVKGKFVVKIQESDFKEITELLNYLDFEELENSYMASWTDDQTSTLKITYDNGKVKTIYDYGLIGTYGLDRLYELLFDLRFNQEWK